MKQNPAPWVKGLSAFTLVELIVVIVVITILAGIGYISFSGISTMARDSARISDIRSIRTSIELSYYKNSVYPEIENGAVVSFSGSELWSQGFFDNDIRFQTRNISDTPVDPITWSPYLYSRLYNGQEFQVGGALEQGSPVAWTLIAQSYAEDFNQAYITWNYNSLIIAKVIDEELNILWAPSLLTTIQGDSTLQDVVSQQGFLLNNYSALPPGFTTNTGSITSWVSIMSQDPQSIIFFRGDVEDLKDPQEAHTFVQKAATFFENNGNPLPKNELFAKLTISPVVEADENLCEFEKVNTSTDFWAALDIARTLYQTSTLRAFKLQITESAPAQILENSVCEQDDWVLTFIRNTSKWVWQISDWLGLAIDVVDYRERIFSLPSNSQVRYVWYNGQYYTVVYFVPGASGWIWWKYEFNETGVQIGSRPVGLSPIEIVYLEQEKCFDVNLDWDIWFQINWDAINPNGDILELYPISLWAFWLVKNAGMNNEEIIPLLRSDATIWSMGSSQSLFAVRKDEEQYRIIVKNINPLSTSYIELGVSNTWRVASRWEILRWQDLINAEWEYCQNVF